MSSTTLNNLEVQFETLSAQKSENGLVKLASAQYAVINEQLQKIAASSDTNPEQDFAESKLHEYREKVLDLITNSRSTSIEDVVDKLEFLDRICTTESCFDEHFYEGQLFKSVVKDAPLLLATA